MGDDGIQKGRRRFPPSLRTTISGDQARCPIAELAQQSFSPRWASTCSWPKSPSVLDGMRNGSLDASLFSTGPI
ncbi:MAG: hypothetical protein R3A10_05575 [Caldilineaceae bacterium]